MNKIELAWDIANNYHQIVREIEPDCLQFTQDWWDDALPLYDTKTPDDLYLALVNGPWGIKDLEMFSTQLRQIKVIMSEM